MSRGKPATVCLVAARMLYDRVTDPARAAESLVRLGAQPRGFRVFPHTAGDEWREAMDGITAWRRQGVHLVGVVDLSNSASAGDGILFLPPHAIPSETIARTAFGRPITSLVSHAVFDDSMIITHCVHSDVTQCHAHFTNGTAPLTDTVEALRRGRRP